MTSDGRHRSGRMAHRIAATKKANDWVCVLQREQRLVGHLGRIRGRLCIDRIAGLPFSDEPSWIEEKFEGQRRSEDSRMTVPVEVFFKTSGIHSQQYALKNNQSIRLSMSPQATQRVLLRVNPQKAIIRRYARCEPMNQAEMTVTAIAGH